MQQQRFLKTLVIVLAVFIAVAVGFVVYGFVRLGVKAPSPTAAAETGAVAAAGFDVSDLGQPVGTEIVQIAPLPGSRAAVVLRGGALPDRIVVLDLNTGRAMGTAYATHPGGPKP